jgi:hypothetical protein
LLFNDIGFGAESQYSVYQQVNTSAVKEYEEQTVIYLQLQKRNIVLFSPPEPERRIFFGDSKQLRAVCLNGLQAETRLKWLLARSVRHFESAFHRRGKKKSICVGRDAL